MVSCISKLLFSYVRGNFGDQWLMINEMGNALRGMAVARNFADS